MMSEITGYREEVQTIKTAILRAQYAAAKSANAQQLQLYFAVGGYVPPTRAMARGEPTRSKPSANNCGRSCQDSGASPQQVSNICESSLKLGLLRAMNRRFSIRHS